jgi:chromosome segregation ATPase
VVLILVVKKAGGPSCPAGLDEAFHSCCQRIRALEAERDEWIQHAIHRTDQLAEARNRVEKAEARVDIERGATGDFKRAWEAESKWRKELEVRVKELEAALAECKEANWSLAKERDRG